jgi:hypothetical protein
MDQKHPGISSLDLTTLLELVDERVAMGSKQRIDTVILLMVATEIAIL